MHKLEEPVELFGSKVTETVGTVTWSGSAVEPGEFVDLPFSMVPEREGAQLAFPAVQTYSNGESVRWIGPPDAEWPAALVEAVDLGAHEGTGELGVLHETVHEVQELSEKVEAVEAQPRAQASEESAGADPTGIVLGSIGIALGAAALLVALFRRRA